MSKRLIYAEDAIEALKQLQKSISGDYTELDPLVMAGCGYIGDCIGALECLPSAQPELIEKTAYIRGFEQGRTQGMIDAQGGKK